MAWCLCDWKPCQNAVVYEQGSSVVYKKRAFEQTPEPSEQWRCYIEVFTNDSGGSRVNLRTVGYYVHEDAREKTRAELDAVEVEMDEILRRIVEIVTEKYIQIADVHNEVLSGLEPGLLARLPPVSRFTECHGEGSQTNKDAESAISAIWQGTAVVMVTSGGSVHVNYNFLSPLQYCDRPTVRDVGIQMKKVTEAVNDYEAGATDVRKARDLSQRLLQNISEQLYTLGDIFKMTQYCQSIKHRRPNPPGMWRSPGFRNTDFRGPTLF